MTFYAGLITLVGTLIIFLVTKGLIGSTKVSEPVETVAPKIYGLRKAYFFLLALVIALSLFGSLRGLPYYSPKDGPSDYVVSVTGRTWSWEVTGMVNGQDQTPVTELQAGKLVEFVLSAEDVNHGFGIYNEAGQILTQTQAMPGYPSKLYYSFTEPGTYHIVCMEYCGSGHAVMNSTLQVQ